MGDDDYLQSSLIHLSYSLHIIHSRAPRRFQLVLSITTSLFFRIVHHAMFSLLSYLLAVFIHSSRSNPCPYIRSSIVLNECHFNTKIYAQLGVSVTHSKSIYFSASYSLERSNETLFISNFHDRWLLPFPFLLSCSNHSIIPSHLAFTECQSTIHHPSQEYMTTSLSSIELPHHGLQPILYLSQGFVFLTLL